MFMDLIASTSYAEKLGYIKYSKFIIDVYKELDEYVLETKGHIYQYVGDEVVIVWSLENGIRNYNCLRFFVLFKNKLSELRNKFLNKYEIFPEFKAGFHFGEVAITEIGGVLRKDIAFHGDAVNTTARICSKCRDLNERILISGDLAKKLGLNNRIYFEPKGSYILKGKKIDTALYTINENELNKLTSDSQSYSTWK